MKATIVVLLLVPAFVMLASCSGVRMTEEERISCRNTGCTPWTDAELRELVNRAGSEGYRKGWTDANRQGGRDL